MAKNAMEARLGLMVRDCQMIDTPVAIRRRSGRTAVPSSSRDCVRVPSTRELLPRLSTCVIPPLQSDIAAVVANVGALDVVDDGSRRCRGRHMHH